MQLLSIAVINWIIYAGTILAIITSIKLFIDGSLGLFPMLFIFMLAPEFFIPMRTLTSLFHVAMTGVSAAENIISFIDSPERSSMGDKEFKNKREFKVSDLSFTYPDGTQSLKDINMTFKKGNLTAIVGHSGCGKSTLVSILAGELKSNENEIFIDDTDIQNIKLEDKIKNILKITHDSHIFSGTVRDNLTMANENLSDETMIEVLKTVHKLNKNEGITIILITHYMDEVIDADKVFVMEGGKVALQGTPREVFSKVDELEGFRLDVPQVTKLAYELKKSGLPINETVLTVEEFREAIRKCYS